MLRVASVCLLLAGCGSDPRPTDGGAGLDGGNDGGTDRDAGLDGAVDAEISLDASNDSGSDAGSSDVGTGSDGGSSDAGVCDVPILFFTGPIPQAVMENNIDPPSIACVGTLASGPDRTYALIASLGAGTYRVTVTPFDDALDPMIYALDGCDEEAACIDGTMLNGPGEVESLDLELEADEIVYVVVDTEPASGGGPVQIRGEKL